MDTQKGRQDPRRRCLMGSDAITQSDNGQTSDPSNGGNWSDWGSATATRNFILQDTLLDWLDLYGEGKGFQKDSELTGYDPRTDFATFIFTKASEFEAAVFAHLKTLTTIVTICQDHKDAQKREKAVETFAAMASGVPVIYQAVLWNAEIRTYGIPDLLIRSDELTNLFPNILTPEEAIRPAPDLVGAKWHYRVIDIKYTTLHLTAGGELNNSGSAPAYKAQLFVYNHGLGRLQGFHPPVSYLMGRSWEQTVRGVSSRGDSCMARLAPVSQNSTLAKGKLLASEVNEALKWIRRVRREGQDWVVLPKPSVPELRPNMKNTEDSPWSSAKKQIAKELEELTQLWYVGVDKRREANQLGIYSWTDKNCTAEKLGVKGDKTQPVLQAVLSINQSKTGPPVMPAHVTAAEKVWRKVPKVEFYVDFETVNDLDDDFSTIPKRGGQPIIFMIGCGHIEGNQWQFNCFTADSLNPNSEANIIEKWIDHMKQVKARLDPKGENPLIFHWSPAETSNLKDAYNAAVKRHPTKSTNWLDPNWFDFLKEVIKTEPVVMRGSFAFGLKAVTQAMYKQGFIKTRWGDGPVDGLGAMVGAWSCEMEAKSQNVSLGDVELMQSIQSYNEVDCKVMMEIVQYLRTNH